MSAALAEVRAGFDEAGIPAGDGRVDVAVVTGADSPGAVAADEVVVVGRGGRRVLAGRASHVRRFVPLPDPRAPHLIVPVDRRRVASYAIRTWTAPTSLARGARNAAC